METQAVIEWIFLAIGFFYCLVGCAREPLAKFAAKRVILAANGIEVLAEKESQSKDRLQLIAYIFYILPPTLINLALGQEIKNNSPASKAQEIIEIMNSENDAADFMFVFYSSAIICVKLREWWNPKSFAIAILMSYILKKYQRQDGRLNVFGSLLRVKAEQVIPKNISFPSFPVDQLELLKQPI